MYDQGVQRPTLSGGKVRSAAVKLLTSVQNVVPLSLSLLAQLDLGARFIYTLAESTSSTPSPSCTAGGSALAPFIGSGGASSPDAGRRGARLKGGRTLEPPTKRRRQQLKPSLQPAHPGGGLLCSCRRCSHACSPTSIGTVGSPIELCSSLTEMRPSRARCTATSWASTCGSVSTGRHGAHRIARRAGTWRGVVHCGEPGADLVDGCGAEVAQRRTPPQPAQLGAQRCNERDARRRVWLQLSRRGMEHLAELPSTRAAAQTALDD